MNAALFYQLEKELSLEDSIKVNNLFLICTSSLEENHLQPELITEVSSHTGPCIIPYYPKVPLESQLNTASAKALKFVST